MNFIPYQEQILTAYLVQYSPEERIQYLKAINQFPDEKKNAILQDFATQLPELQPLVQHVMGQEDNMLSFGGMQKYQDGGIFPQDVGYESMSPEEQRRLQEIALSQDSYYGQNGSSGNFDYPMYDSTFGEPETTWEQDPNNPNRKYKVPVQQSQVNQSAQSTSPSSQRWVKTGTTISNTVNSSSKPVTQQAAEQVAATPQVPTSKPVQTTAKRSNVGSDKVRELQKMLNAAGYLDKKGNTKNGKWDGIEGKLTEKAYQKYMQDMQSRSSQGSSRTPLIDYTGRDVDPIEYSQYVAENTRKSIPSIINPSVERTNQNTANSKGKPSVKQSTRTNLANSGIDFQKGFDEFSRQLGNAAYPYISSAVNYAGDALNNGINNSADYLHNGLNNFIQNKNQPLSNFPIYNEPTPKLRYRGNTLDNPAINSVFNSYRNKLDNLATKYPESSREYIREFNRLQQEYIQKGLPPEYMEGDGKISDYRPTKEMGGNYYSRMNKRYNL